MSEGSRQHASRLSAQVSQWVLHSSTDFELFGLGPQANLRVGVSFSFFHFFSFFLGGGVGSSNVFVYISCHQISVCNLSPSLVRRRSLGSTRNSALGMTNKNNIYETLYHGFPLSLKRGSTQISVKKIENFCFYRNLKLKVFNKDIQL